MPSLTSYSDERLLEETGRDPDAFAVFYRRHLPVVLGFLLRRAHDREVAADLTAEVFAAALHSRGSFDGAHGSARGWLCTIAINKLVDSRQRGLVEESARRRLAMRAIPLYDDDLERVGEIADAATLTGPLEGLLDQLGPGVRAAIEARILDEDEYRQIADRLQTSEAVVRQRVSRGLRLLRTRVSSDA
jgi:RNA polymerase sigma factor (sigma-70 family)